MKSSSSPRTPPWPGRFEDGRLPAPEGGGAASLVVIFLLFVFSALGLSMIFMSGLHLRINGWRKFSVFLDYASENGLKRGLSDLGGLCRRRRTEHDADRSCTK